MPKRMYGYDENGVYGSVIGNRLPEGWATSREPVEIDKPKPRRGRPPKQVPQLPIDEGDQSLEKEMQYDGSSPD